MKNHIDEKSIDIILTSPPYNIMRRGADEMMQTYREHVIENEWEEYCKIHDIDGNIDFFKSLKKKENQND